jgi:glycerophosphoryl diester phosphodiesterase
MEPICRSLFSKWFSTVFSLTSALIISVLFAQGIEAQVADTFAPGLRAPKQGGVYVVAHRGVHKSIPENTLAAYQAAIDLGCDFVEIDVRTTKDNELVSIHDATVDRYTGAVVTGRVADFTLQELKAIDIGSRVDPKWEHERVPTVDEICRLCRGKIGIYLDLKSAELKPLVNIVKKYGMEKDVVWYIPSDKIKELRELCPSTWPMPDPGPESQLESLLIQCQPQVVASTWRYFSTSLVRRCHESRALVIVDDGGPETWKPMLEAQVDGIQTDHPAELIQLLKVWKK